MPPNYSTTFDHYIAKAQQYAQHGEILGMEIAIENAKICAQVCQLDIKSWQREIELCGYTNALPLILQQAKESTLEGKLHELNDVLKDAQFYTAKIGQDISPQICAIKQLGYN